MINPTRRNRNIKLFQKWFGKQENKSNNSNKNKEQKMEINNFQIEELIRKGNNEAFLKVAAEIGKEKIKCNANQEELASIHWAAGSGNFEIVKYLLSDEINENANLTRNNNFSPLHAAAMNGFTKIVKLLIEKGANVNVQTDPQKYAPIHSASFAGHLETIKVLVKNGADLNLRNYRNELPIDTAKRQNQLETIKYFEELK